MLRMQGNVKQPPLSNVKPISDCFPMNTDSAERELYKIKLLFYNYRFRPSVAPRLSYCFAAYIFVDLGRGMVTISRSIRYVC